MIRPRRSLAPLVLPVLLVLQHAPASRADTIQTLFGGAATLLDHADATTSYHLIAVDLNHYEVHAVSTPSNGPGDRETDRQTTRDFVTSSPGVFGHQVQVAVNANFFNPSDLTTPTADLSGLAMNGGQVVSAYDPNYGSIGFGAGNLVRMLSGPSPDLTGIATAVSGTYFLITAGVVKTTGYDSTAPNSRTIIGTDRDGSWLFLFAVDASGFTGTPAGLSYADAANAMNGAVQTLLGSGVSVYNALNLDGGTSATMVVADPTARLVNTPKFLPYERPVGNNLGFYFTPVPEPGTLALVVVGGLGLAIALRRGRASE
jgi:hypothetical protein